MTRHFPFIAIENKAYPTVIVGGDRFTGLFGPPRTSGLESVITTPKYISSVLEACYQSGFRGFDVSMSDNVITCFERLKEKYADSVGIGNPNWDCGVMLGNEPLRDSMHRINKHLWEYVYSESEKAAVQRLRESQRSHFSTASDSSPLTEKEIGEIYLKVDKYQANVDRIKDSCDFCLVGTVFADWLPLLGRTDILEQMIGLARENGLVPLSIHHFTSLVMSKLDYLDVAGHWTYINNYWQLLTEEAALEAVHQSDKPITAFCALVSRKEKEIEASLDYLFNHVKVDSVDFGVETPDEARLISSILFNNHFPKL
ncbi:hypothetical protein ACFL2Q_03570 [Thermodesulfobacteriota bacterium]